MEPLLCALLACGAEPGRPLDAGRPVDSDVPADTELPAETDLPPDSDVPAGDCTGDTATPPAAQGITVRGTVSYVATLLPVEDGLCVDVLDPTPMLTGQPPTVLGSDTTRCGAFAVTGVRADSLVGLEVEVHDCGAPNTTVFTTTVGIPPSAYETLDGGDTLAGVEARSIDRAMLDDLQAGVALLGDGGSLESSFLFGSVLDAAGAPITGATIGCPSCPPVYYLDGDPADGLFGAAATPNSTTLAAGGGRYLIPNGVLGVYSPSDGVHEFEPTILVTRPGSALIFDFVAR